MVTQNTGFFNLGGVFSRAGAHRKNKCALPNPGAIRSLPAPESPTASGRKNQTSSHLAAPPEDTPPPLHRRQATCLSGGAALTCQTRKRARAMVRVLSSALAAGCFAPGILYFGKIGRSRRSHALHPFFADPAGCSRLLARRRQGRKCGCLPRVSGGDLAASPRGNIPAVDARWVLERCHALASSRARDVKPSWEPQSSSTTLTPLP